MLSKEFLTERGYCCGHGCLMCPYEPKHTKGNKNLMSYGNLEKKILIVSALEVETQGKLKDYNVLYTGVGKVNATYELTKHFGKHGSHIPYSLIINYGTAGSRKIKRKTLVDCTKFVQRDMDVTPLGFKIGQTPYDEIEEINDELKKASSRQVHITLFSFTKISKKIGELVSYDIDEDKLRKVWKPKMILVVDKKFTMMGSARKHDDSRSIFTENQAITEIATDHLILDITLAGNRLGFDSTKIVSSLSGLVDILDTFASTNSSINFIYF